ncbi:hypothetical protein ABEB36_007256 [Hypothenemus hampei]|uniref:Breast cancer anti-estrogen resistance protein 1 n=1 Tax=Hypothenemus hampei TaxID=57062 RepID=A0ABD1ETC1_HYPHA
MPQPADIPAQHCLARALYDNTPDTPDELAFQKNDTLIVLEQNIGNIEGWWLCSLRGRQGICPANRLRLLPGEFDTSLGQSSRGCSPQFFNSHHHHSESLSYLEQQGKRRSWHLHPNQVITPKKFNDVYLYDMPPSRCSPLSIQSPSPQASSNDCYDIPPRPVPVGPCPRCSTSPMTSGGETYDVPRLLHQPQLTPSSSASSLTSSSNRSSLSNMPEYDVPRSILRPVYPSTTYDVPSNQRQLKELPLELDSALENLERLETDTLSATSKLLGFVGPNWRQKDKLENTRMDIKLAVTRLRTSLHDLAEYGEGTLGNAAKASDKNLLIKLAPLVQSLRKSDSLVQNASDALDKHNWAIKVLAHAENSSLKPDELEQLIACARALTEDVRQIASFIQGNATLLFKKTTSSECPDEYDYVSLESKETIAKQHKQILEELPTNQLKTNFENSLKHAEDDCSAFQASKLPQEDRKLLKFFAGQLVCHYQHLTNAIDAFLQTVEHNQPPKIFLAHGKFVVLSAHKLVHIGDTVHRNVTSKEIKEKALRCANALSDALATSVNKTKQAALQFPLVSAVQEMVDSVVDISHFAKDLKVCLVQAADTTF